MSVPASVYGCECVCVLPFFCSVAKILDSCYVCKYVLGCATTTRTTMVMMMMMLLLMMTEVLTGMEGRTEKSTARHAQFVTQTQSVLYSMSLIHSLLLLTASSL